MSMRISLQIDGNSDGATTAVDRTAKAVDRLGAQTRRTTTATTGLSAAAVREQAAITGATAAARLNTFAMQANEATMRRSAIQRSNLLYALSGIGRALVTGVNPLVVAAHHGSELSTVYGPGEGGLGRALGQTTRIALRMARPFAAGAAVIALAAGAIAGMRHEINKTITSQISFKDTFVATIQVIGAGLFDAYIAPFVSETQNAFSAMWQGIIWVTKTGVNSLVVTIGSMGLAVEHAILTTSALLRTGAATIHNFFVDALQSTSDYVLGGFDAIINGVNTMMRGIGVDKAAELFGFSGQLPGVVKPDFSGLKAQYGGDLEGELASINKTYGDAFDKLFTEDHAGNFFDAVRDQAIKNIKPDEAALKAAQKLADAYKRITASARDRIASSKIEQQALGMTEVAANKLRFSHQLLTAAMRAGITVTPKQKAELAGLATEMANVMAETKALTDAYNFGKDTFRTFFTEGISGWDNWAGAAANAFDTIRDKALGMAADGIFDLIFNSIKGAFTGGSSGPIDLQAGLFGFATGGWTGSGRRDGISGVVHNEEFVVRAGPAAQYRPVLEAINNNTPLPANSNGGGSPTFVTNIYAGNGGIARSEMQQMLDERDRDIAANLGNFLANGRRRATPGFT